MTNTPTTLCLRTMTAADYDEVAALIRQSTNEWYQSHGMNGVFRGAADECRIFCDLYDALDPGCGLVVEDTKANRIVGSCFYHPRPTHVSVGIVNTAFDYGGRGVARQMLQEVVARADAEQKPVRLVSSAFNLDSFSLYTRLGFVPRQAFQDLVLTVPEGGLLFAPPPGIERVRPMHRADASALDALEFAISGIKRSREFLWLTRDVEGIWNSLIIEDDTGKPSGYLFSSNHPAVCMVGPGVARTDADALALLYAQLNHLRGRTPVFLVPVTASDLVRTCYAWGARNVEIHFAQVRGKYEEPRGIVFPSFLPESG